MTAVHYTRRIYAAVARSQTRLHVTTLPFSRQTRAYQTTLSNTPSTRAVPMCHYFLFCHLETAETIKHWHRPVFNQQQEALKMYPFLSHSAKEQYSIRPTSSFSACEWSVIGVDDSFDLVGQHPVPYCSTGQAQPRLPHVVRATKYSISKI